MSENIVKEKIEDLSWAAMRLFRHPAAFGLGTGLWLDSQIGNKTAPVVVLTDMANWGVEITDAMTCLSRTILYPRQQVAHIFLCKDLAHNEAAVWLTSKPDRYQAQGGYTLKQLQRIYKKCCDEIGPSGVICKIGEAGEVPGDPQEE